MAFQFIESRLGRRYGYRPDNLDTRDHRLSIQLSLLDSIPATSDLEPGMPPVYDQGDTSSCTGNGSAAAFDYSRKKQGLPFLSPSRLFIYYNARVLEGDPEGDDGAMIRDCIKSLASQGVCPESEWPFLPGNVTAAPPKSDFTDALANRALQYTRVTQSSFHIEHCLGVLKLPIVFGFQVYESFESDQVAKTGIMPIPAANESLLGGHCVVACGHDRGKKLVKCRNSWGASWGQGGYFWMPYPVILGVMANDLWALELVSTTPVIQTT